jgi:hypothetical protein
MSRISHRTKSRVKKNGITAAIGETSRVPKVLPSANGGSPLSLFFVPYDKRILSPYAERI